MGLRDDVREALRLVRVGGELARAGYKFYKDVDDDLDQLEIGLETALGAVKAIRKKGATALVSLSGEARDAIGSRPPDPGRRTS